MNDFAVTRTCPRADGALTFEDHDLAAGLSQRPRHRESQHTRADDDAIDLFQNHLIFTFAISTPVPPGFTRAFTL